MKSIIKNEKGDSSNINNYRSIALVTALSKIFELCIFNILNELLDTKCFICKNTHIIRMLVITNILIVCAFLQIKHLLLIN